MPSGPRARPPGASDASDASDASSRHIARLTRRGVTAAALERALGLSPGYLSKVRHARVTPSEQLRVLLSLLARHPSLLGELGVVVEAPPPLPLPARPAPTAGGPAGHALPFVLELAPRLDEAGVAWAVGGGQAMNAWGIARPTDDVDLFIHDGDRRALQVFRDAGVSPDLVSSTTFICFPTSRHQPADRIDIVFPTLLPLADAPARPERRLVHGRELPFLAPLDLFAGKLVARGPHDEADARALVDCGLVTPAAARRALSSVERLPKAASHYVTFHHDRPLGEERLAGLLHLDPRRPKGQARRRTR